MPKNKEIINNNIKDIYLIANTLRKDVLYMLKCGGSGHLGGAYSSAVVRDSSRIRAAKTTSVSCRVGLTRLSPVLSLEPQVLPVLARGRESPEVAVAVNTGGPLQQQVVFAFVACSDAGDPETDGFRRGSALQFGYFQGLRRQQLQ